MLNQVCEPELIFPAWAVPPCLPIVSARLRAAEPAVSFLPTFYRFSALNIKRYTPGSIQKS